MTNKKSGITLRLSEKDEYILETYMKEQKIATKSKAFIHALRAVNPLSPLQKILYKQRILENRIDILARGESPAWLK